MIRNIISGVAAMVFVVVTLVACEPPAVEVVEEPAEVEPLVRTGDVLGDWRRDPARGEGGEFAFTFGEQSISGDWGYADFRYFPGSDLGRLTLLNNPLGGEHFPVLRIVASAKAISVEELIGKTFATDKINLKMEKKKKSGIRADGTVTVIAISDSMIEGTFSAVTEDGEKLDGSFRARVHLAEEAE
jgi:hypothetical protein